MPFYWVTELYYP